MIQQHLDWCCMDRPKRAATKVTDFRKYHLSGDLDTQLQGRVDSRVIQFEMAKTAEELKQQLEEERERSTKMMEDVEIRRIQHELEAEKLKQQQWQATLQQMEESRQHVEAEHQKYLAQLKEAATTSREDISNGMLEWFKNQSLKLSKSNPETDREKEERLRLEQEAKAKEIQDLQAQQEQISQKLAELTSTTTKTSSMDDRFKRALAPETGQSQEVLLQQLKNALGSKKEEDLNKLLLKALVTSQNRTPAKGGTNTLRAGLLNNITGTETNSMADWLVNLNRQEEGESDISKLALLGDPELGNRQVKVKSGMLDKATTNIQQKQVWPQQNLGEDWADEDVEFKQMKFEHLVAGETRTIKTATYPAQILGRLRLLHRIAYLKLRG